MKENIILISAASLSGKDRALREKYNIPSLGLLSIASILKMHGHDVAVIDFFHQRIYNKNDFITRIEEASKFKEPSIVGINVLTETVYDTYKIAKLVKKMFPKVNIVVGGPHATFMYEEMLKDCNEIDYVVLREGEATIIELIEHIRNPKVLKKENISGIAFRNQNQGIITTKPRPFVIYLDTLPFPYFTALSFRHGRYGELALVFMSSRGCPGNCIFCASRALSGNKYRMHSAEWMISLVYYYVYKEKIDSVGIMDDTFVANRKRLRQFCKYLRQIKMNLIWTCKSRVDTICEENMQLLAEAGCRSVHIGCESGDDQVLKSINKNITVDSILKAIKIINKYQMRAECSFMLGHHTDNLETLEKTIFLAHAIRENEVGLSFIGINTPLPGTWLFNNAEKLRLKFITREWDKCDLYTVIFYTDNFKPEDIKRAEYLFSVELLSFSNELNFSGKDLSDFKNKVTSFIYDIKNNIQERAEYES